MGASVASMELRAASIILKQIWQARFLYPAAVIMCNIDNFKGRPHL
jgi:hypothetical protein